MDLTAPDIRSIDLSVVVIANAINLLIMGIFLARARGYRSLEYALGVIMVLSALPLLYAAIHNALVGRPWWTIVLPGIMVTYLILELLLDYVFRVEFRKTAWLWPYLVAFYVALMGMIGYSFLVSRVHGFITLSTYFGGLLATWYSYSKVGHG